MIVDVRGVSFARNDQPIVEDVTFGIGRDESVSMVGPSGAGKTTLLRLIAGLERPTAGEIAIGGEDRAARGTPRVGLLFQDLGLFPHMRVLGNVSFPLRVQRLPRQERQREAMDALDRAGLGALARRFPAQLSGGEKQRVGLIRTLLSRPAVVLLDEPFSSLDPHLVDHFAGWLRSMQEISAVPLLMVTHDVNLALRWSTRILVLNGGRLLQVGTPRELFDEPVDEFVATYLGPANIVDGKLGARTGDGTWRCTLEASGLELTVRAPANREEGSTARVLIRPHHLALTTDETGSVPGRVLASRFSGAGTIVDVEVGDRQVVQAWAPADYGPVAPSGPVRLAWPPARATVL